MKFSLLTYNLFLNRANSNVGKILSLYHPNIVCLQEVRTDAENLQIVQKLGYKLANYSNSFTRKGRLFGVATFYDPKIFTFSNSQSFSLTRGFYEFMRFIANNEPQKRTVLVTGFSLKKTKQKIVIYNVHLAPFATNIVRDKQIRIAFEDLELGIQEPIITAGDFNYPYGRKKFEILIGKYGLSEATNNIFYTLETRLLKLFLIRMKLDYILYKNIQHIATEKIQVRHSDHFPIIAQFKI